MSDTNIQINYETISEMVESTNTLISGNMGATVSGYASLGQGMSKSSGEMLDAIKVQMGEEQSLASAMAEACTQFVSSIRNAAESFRGLDTSLAGKIQIVDDQK